MILASPQGSARTHRGTKYDGLRGNFLTVLGLFALQSQSGGSPHSSPSHSAGCSMPMPIRSTSAGSTPTHTPQDCLAGVGGDVLEAFAQGETSPSASEAPPEAETHVCAHLNKGDCFAGVPRNLRNDLLVAADSITNTMSSLVKELHSGQFNMHVH